MTEGISEQAICSVDECDGPIRSRGLCWRHFSAWKRFGDPLGRPEPAPEVECSIDGCDRISIARGWCSLHYQRWRVHGDPEAPNRRLKENRTARVHEPVICSVEGCPRQAIGRGWCEGHYRRWMKHKDPLKGGDLVSAVWCKAEGCSATRYLAGYCFEHYAVMRPSCKVEGCSRAVHGQHLCSTHLDRMKRFGDPNATPPRFKEGPCQTEGCTKTAFTKGLCRRCYMKSLGQEVERFYHLKNRFGLTVEQYVAMLENQGHRCAICGTDKPERVRGRTASFVVDHDHTTGAVRGLTCHKCNRGSGFFRDDPEIVLKAYHYLLNPPGVPDV